jgi:hypothetical protein
VSLKESHLKEDRCLVGILILLSSIHLENYEFGKPAPRYIVATKNNNDSKPLCDGFGINVISRLDVRTLHNISL